MNKSWKAFIIAAAALLCTIIVCLTINITINKITKNLSDTSQITDQANGNDVINQDNTNALTDNNIVTATDAQGNTVAATDASGNVITNPATPAQSNANPNNSNVVPGSTTPSTVNNPLQFNKSQIVSYYNTCLKKSYSQPKMDATKTEKISVSFDDKGVLVNGKTNGTVTSIANMIVSSNQKDTKTSKSFTNGVASDGTSASAFVLPANLSASGAKSATISKSGSGYKIVITLVQESCNFTTMPPHNKSCAWPLNFNDIDFKGYAKITSAVFNYPGTKLTITIDSNGRVTYAQVDMPLTVDNATGEILKVLKGTTVGVSHIGGQWTCKNTMTF